MRMTRNPIGATFSSKFAHNAKADYTLNVEKGRLDMDLYQNMKIHEQRSKQMQQEAQNWRLVNDKDEYQPNRAIRRGSRNRTR